MFDCFQMAPTKLTPLSLAVSISTTVTTFFGLLAMATPGWQGVGSLFVGLWQVCFSGTCASITEPDCKLDLYFVVSSAVFFRSRDYVYKNDKTSQMGTGIDLKYHISNFEKLNHI